MKYKGKILIDLDKIIKQTGVKDLSNTQDILTLKEALFKESQQQVKNNGVLYSIIFCNHGFHSNTTHKNGFYQCNICDGLIRVIER